MKRVLWLLLAVGLLQSGCAVYEGLIQQQDVVGKKTVFIRTEAGVKGVELKTTSGGFVLGPDGRVFRGEPFLMGALRCRIFRSGDTRSPGAEISVCRHRCVDALPGAFPFLALPGLAGDFPLMNARGYREALSRALSQALSEIGHGLQSRGTEELSEDTDLCLRGLRPNS
jgi:hypothetical protein